MRALEYLGLMSAVIGVAVGLCMLWEWVFRRVARRCEGVVAGVFTGRTAAPAPGWVVVESRRVLVEYTDQRGTPRTFAQDDPALQVGARVNVLHARHWPRTARITGPVPAPRSTKH